MNSLGLERGTQGWNDVRDALIGEVSGWQQSDYNNVMGVVANRSQNTGMTAQEVVSAKSQFDGFKGGNKAAKRDPDEIAKAEAAMEAAIAGTLTTDIGTRTHFATPTHTKTMDRGYRMGVMTQPEQFGPHMFSEEIQGPYAATPQAVQPVDEVSYGMMGPGVMEAPEDIDQATVSFDEAVAAMSALDDASFAAQNAGVANPVGTTATPSMSMAGYAVSTMDNDLQPNEVDVAGTAPDQGRKGLGMVDTTSGYSSPVGVDGHISSHVGTRESPTAGASVNHKGTDIVGAVAGEIAGAQAQAVAAGTVTQAGARPGYGNSVTVEHPDGTTSVYGHMGSVSVKPGDEVAAGQSIGTVGNTGTSTGAHMHFEHMDRFGTPVDARFSPALSDIATPQEKPGLDVGTAIAAVSSELASPDVGPNSVGLPGVDTTVGTPSTPGFSAPEVSSRAAEVGSMDAFDAAVSAAAQEMAGPGVATGYAGPGVSVQEAQEAQEAATGLMGAGVAPAEVSATPSARSAQEASMAALGEQMAAPTSDSVGLGLKAAMASHALNSATPTAEVAAPDVNSVSTTDIQGNVNTVGIDDVTSAVAASSMAPADRVGQAFDAVNEVATPTDRVGQAFDTINEVTAPEEAVAQDAVAPATGASLVDATAVAAAQQAATQRTAPQQAVSVTPAASIAASTAAAPAVAGAMPGLAEQAAADGFSPASGASVGYSPFGGYASVHPNAPEHVQAAATGPGLMGFLGMNTTPSVDTTQSSGLLGGLADAIGGMLGGSGGGGGGGYGGSGGGGGGGYGGAWGGGEDPDDPAH